MASTVIQSKGGKRQRRRRAGRAMSDINITPFVDVMLVLLVVFMVAAPLLVLGVPINLPKAQVEPLPSVQEPISITVTNQGEVFIQDVSVPSEELIDKISAISGAKDEQRIFVRGDEEVDYGLVLEVVGAISSAGYRRIGLVSDQKRQ